MTHSYELITSNGTLGLCSPFSLTCFVSDPNCEENKLTSTQKNIFEHQLAPLTQATAAS